MTEADSRGCFWFSFHFFPCNGFRSNYSGHYSVLTLQHFMSIFVGIFY